MSRCRVAIACQGGGSHTAFTAGCSSGSSTARRSTSTTSSGSAAPPAARCARCWPGPRSARATATAPGRLLDAFWADNSASTPLDVAANAWLMWAATLQSTGWLPQVSPYDLPVDGLGEFRALLTRRVDFAEFTPDPGGPAARRRRGRRAQRQFRAFHSYHEAITPDMILASAAIPNVFPPSTPTAARSGTACSPRTRPCRSCSTLRPTSCG
jgi:NTE family protein